MERTCRIARLEQDSQPTGDARLWLVGAGHECSNGPCTADGEDEAEEGGEPDHEDVRQLVAHRAGLALRAHGTRRVTTRAELAPTSRTSAPPVGSSPRSNVTRTVPAAVASAVL
ncbi:hypothetical protein SDC9_118234 [bioreactor metagenome]|uniref:Uncharacterized protein n=1 Tax=bioreactor metagenome TaxID=1076179 RepID=A0A645C0H5_9ZZZZ